jgi:uncharacterized membrane protein (DUF106 family)
LSKKKKSSLHFIITTVHSNIINFLLAILTNFLNLILKQFLRKLVEIAIYPHFSPFLKKDYFIGLVIIMGWFCCVFSNYFRLFVVGCSYLDFAH